MSTLKIFGLINGSAEQGREAVKEFYKLSTIFMVFEKGSKKEGPHTHYLAETKRTYKNLRSMRDAWAKIVFKHTGKKKSYSVKEFDETRQEECLRYLCKDEEGHKKICVAGEVCDVRCPSNVVLNGLSIVREKLEDYHKLFWENRKDKHGGDDEKEPFWKKIYNYIEEKDDTVFSRLNSKTPRKIANYIYDYFEENERFLQNERFIELCIKTIMIKAFKDTELKDRFKKYLVDTWVEKIHLDWKSYLSYLPENPISEDEDL